MFDDAPTLDLDWLDPETAAWVLGAMILAAALVWAWSCLDRYLEDLRKL